MIFIFVSSAVVFFYFAPALFCQDIKLYPRPYIRPTVRLYVRHINGVHFLVDLFWYGFMKIITLFSTIPPASSSTIMPTRVLGLCHFWLCENICEFCNNGASVSPGHISSIIKVRCLLVIEYNFDTNMLIL